MTSWSLAWAYVPLAVAAVIFVLATYVLPRWQKRADARDHARNDILNEHAHRTTAPTAAPSAEAFDMAAPGEMTADEACHQMQAADLEMLRKVASWRDARRGRPMAHRD